MAGDVPQQPGDVLPEARDVPIDSCTIWRLPLPLTDGMVMPHQAIRKKCFVVPKYVLIPCDDFHSTYFGVFPSIVLACPQHFPALSNTNLPPRNVEANGR